MGVLGARGFLVISAALISGACGGSPSSPVTLDVAGVVVEKYDSRPIVAAIVTVTDGKNAGTQAVTDGNGRFVFSRLVPSPGAATIGLSVTDDDFESLTERITTTQADIRIQLEPRSREEVLSVGPGSGSGVSLEYGFSFETRHAGPVTVTLHSDCPVVRYSYGARLTNSIARGSSYSHANRVFGTGLADAEDMSTSQTDSTAAQVLPPGQYHRRVNAIAYSQPPCRWTASVRYPF